jgi:hypothetical protein
VFPDQAGYAPADALTDGSFPFKVELYTEQANIAISRPWTSGLLAGKTGVLFSPSRMAGDVWTFKTYLFRDAGPDGPPDDAVSAESGEFKVWREIHLVRQVKKTNAIPSANITTFGSHYTPASMKVIDKTASVDLMTAADYDPAVAAAVATQAQHVRAAIDPTISQHGGGNWAITYRNFAAWRTAYQALRGFTNAQMATWLAGPGVNLNTSLKWHAFLKGWAKTITTAACGGYMPAAKDGITIIQFIRLYNRETQPGALRLGGWAPTVPGGVRQRCLFIMVPSSYGNATWVKDTLAHEIGHQLFLPHSPFPAPGTAGAPTGSGDWQERHDAADAQCIMSYSNGTLNFCGLCLLRLRGWDALWLSKNSGDNTRP